MIDFFKVSPLSKVLIKIFAKGFYKVNAGLLLFLFVTIILYCFYIEVLNQTHFEPDVIILFNLSFVLSIISSPVLVILVFAVWTVFTIKSWSYVSSQIIVPENQFLFYSSNSIDRFSQFKSWLLVQLIISIPIIVYGVFAMLIGIAFGYYLIPIVILLFAFFMACISALLYMHTINKLINPYEKTIYLNIAKNWKKPFFSLFLYHCLNNLQVTIAVTKILSFIIIIGGTYILADIQHDLRVTSVICLGIVLTHSLLIYQSNYFETTQLAFTRNFPLSSNQVYLNYLLTYLLLTLPENIWLLLNFNPFESFSLILFSTGTAMFFKSILYLIRLNMRRYLYRIFFLFLLYFIMIMFQLIWVLIPINIFISLWIYNKQYYKLEDL
ncbi:hypothetical protein [Chondrinema litorale]|uniref:hypothetical protein n=1 Tax=Chondrinema litorale TaxID=2994555 RepID=UPI0025437C7E|nr:hypothetical protein [Chondrinema litorale]UZR97084.1 hypothetical protein OQ292_23580 [Chondrinema litorale]